MAIDPHSNETQTKWDHGGYSVMIQSATSSRPIGFCDGTAADEAEIRETAEREGTEITIEKKRLKTGREIWTVSSTDEPEEFDPDFA